MEVMGWSVHGMVMVHVDRFSFCVCEGDLRVDIEQKPSTRIGARGSQSMLLKQMMHAV